MVVASRSILTGACGAVGCDAEENDVGKKEAKSIGEAGVDNDLSLQETLWKTRNALKKRGQDLSEEENDQISEAYKAAQHTRHERSCKWLKW